MNDKKREKKEKEKIFTMVYDMKRQEYVVDGQGEGVINLSRKLKSGKEKRYEIRLPKGGGMWLVGRK